MRDTATKVHRNVVELNGFIKMTAANRIDSAAPMAAKNHFDIFKRSISTAHWIFAMPVSKMATPYSIVSRGKTAINQRDRNAQKRPATMEIKPFARFCDLAA